MLINEYQRESKGSVVSNVHEIVCIKRKKRMNNLQDIKYVINK